MNTLLIALLAGVGFIVAYHTYGRWLGSKIFRLSADAVCPSERLNDGVDYVPTNKYVLWGHHFTSVAGAAPIVGPAIAVIWGWVPAFLWVTIGTVFFAGVHDLGALWASSRHKGKSIGSLSGQYIGHRGRNLFLVVIFLVLLMVNAAFAVVISGLLVSTPTAVIPTWGAIVVALLIGQAIYRLKWSLPLVSVIGVAALYALILVGDRFPVVLPETVLGLSANAFWIVVLFLYAGVASVLPVWLLLQPRDYINGLQLFIALGILYGAVLISAPTVVAPAFNDSLPEGTPSIVPLLFVTIACGAISGFHGIVASGTSSKQLDKEPDARFVGYFGAVGEGLLALGAIIATTAGFRTIADWEAVYSAFGQGGVSAFIEGGAAIVNQGLGIPDGLSATILATMAILFAATTMDTGIRLQRFVVQEAAHIIGFSLNKALATVIVLAVAMGLTFGAGGDGSGGMLIWPLFGTTNQLLAGLTLLVITIMLVKRGRPAIYTLAPLIFLLVMTLYALLIQLKSFYDQSDWFLLGLDLVVLVAALLVTLECAAALKRAFSAPPENI